MSVMYFKRYRMELRLEQLGGHPDTLGLASMPAGFQLLPWSPKLLNQHAMVKWESFRDEIDAHVFPCLSERDGCRRLMREISSRKDFVPQATWLACRDPLNRISALPVGTVQGLMTSSREGAIQNLGVHPDFRARGIGRALLAHALHGFLQAGCRYVNLEVTVENKAAIQLYESVGFRRVETLFKVAEVQFA